MKDAPILPTLDLWSLGHSGSDIADKLGFPNHKHVERIIEHAREIGDPRAVYHVAGGRLLGKGIPFNRRYPRWNQTRYEGFAIVPAIQATHCVRGHLMTPETRRKGGGCKPCQIMKTVLARKLKRLRR